MMHSFSLTEKHVVFYDLPVVFDTAAAIRATVPPRLRPAARLFMSALIGRIAIPDPISARMTGSGQRRVGTSRSNIKSNTGFPYQWEPSYPARIGIMPRDGASQDVRWFDIEPCYVYHPLNAYDLEDTIVLDVIRHGKTFERNHAGPNEGRPTLDQWVIDLTGGKVTESRVDDREQEFPRIDERLCGKRHRYGYTTRFNHGNAAELDKHDYRTHTCTTRSFGNQTTVSEFVFHPSAPDAAEDDGILMGYVHHPDTDDSDLVLVEAQTLHTVATVHLRTRVPNGFHGNWAPTT
jgi:carotenoid cleavage dioxygenase